MAASNEGAFSQLMKKLQKDHEAYNTLLYVIECHPMFLGYVQGKCEMLQPTYESICAEKTNWSKNIQLLHWLRSGDDRQTLQRRLHIFLRLLRQSTEGQEHVANFIDGTNGE